MKQQVPNLLVEEGFSREGVEDRCHVLAVDDWNGEVGRAGRAAEGVAAIKSRHLK